jgi:hypothetical protein
MFKFGSFNFFQTRAELEIITEPDNLLKFFFLKKKIKINTNY